MVQAKDTRQISYIQAINESLHYELESDPSVIIMGEDIAGGGERVVWAHRNPTWYDRRFIVQTCDHSV